MKMATKLATYIYTYIHTNIHTYIHTINELIFHCQIHITWRSWEGAMFVFEIKEQLVTVDRRNVTKFQKQLHV